MHLSLTQTMAERMINQWYDSVGGGDFGGRPHKRTRLNRGPESIAELLAFYDRCALQQLATNTIVADLLKDRLEWCTDSGQCMNDPVPFWVTSVLKEAVRLLVICGWVVWRVLPNGLLQVASPDEITIQYDPSQFEWAPVALSEGLSSEDGWRVAFTAMPKPSLATARVQRVSIAHMRSAAVRSWHECNRAMQIENHWLTRDRHNSAPAVYTTIGATMGLSMNRAVSGHTLASEHGPQFGRPGVGDFNDLVHRRAANRALMEDLSEGDRNRLQAQAQFAGYELTTDTSAHAEHVITDGRAHTEAKTLNSLADSGYVYNRSRHNALNLMDCPPQALGESVNSERTAANHAQYATALSTFRSTVNLYRGALQEMFAGGSTNGVRLTFKKCLGPADLDKLMPMLTTDAAVDMLACTYDLPVKMFDRDLVEGLQTGPPPKPGAAPKQDVSERTHTNRAKANASNDTNGK